MITPSSLVLTKQGWAWSDLYCNCWLTLVSWHSFFHHLGSCEQRLFISDFTVLPLQLNITLLLFYCHPPFLLCVIGMKGKVKLHFMWQLISHMRLKWEKNKAWGLGWVEMLKERGREWLVGWVGLGCYGRACQTAAESQVCYWKLLSWREVEEEREAANEYCRLVAETALGLFIECWPATP